LPPQVPAAEPEFAATIGLSRRFALENLRQQRIPQEAMSDLRQSVTPVKK
jgi:hypothetical protein